MFRGVVEYTKQLCDLVKFCTRGDKGKCPVVGLENMSEMSCHCLDYAHVTVVTVHAPA